MFKDFKTTVDSFGIHQLLRKKRTSSVLHSYAYLQLFFLARHTSELSDGCIERCRSLLSGHTMQFSLLTPKSLFLGLFSLLQQKVLSLVALQAVENEMASLNSYSMLLQRKKGWHPILGLKLRLIIRLKFRMAAPVPTILHLWVPPSRLYNYSLPYPELGTVLHIFPFTYLIPQVLHKVR